MSAMVKKTIYLPEPLKAKIARIAAAQKRSRSAVIRQALEEYLAREERSA